MLEESGSELVAAGEGFPNGNVQLKRLGVDITNVNTTFMGEEDRVTLALRCNANVIFRVDG